MKKAEQEAFEAFSQFQYFDWFKQEQEISKSKFREVGKEDSTNIFIKQNSMDFSININVASRFINKIIDEVEKMVNEGKLKNFYPYLIYFTSHNYPISKRMLVEELAIL